MEPSPTEVVRRYLAAVEQFATGEVLAAHLHPDVEHREYPNLLAPNGATHDRAAMLAAAERGRRVLTSQRFEVVSALCAGSRVALEISWTGVLAVPYGSLAAGAALRTHFAAFIDVEEGKIRRQHEYSCFEPL